MSHPGLSSPDLTEMRRVLDEVALPDRDRRALETALAEIEGHWKNQHRESYGAGVAERDRLHDEVLTVVEQFHSRVTEAIDDLRNGRCSHKDVRTWLRDVHTDHQRLTEQHRGIAAREDGLAEYEAMSPEDYQAEQLRRFPLLAKAAPTLAVKVAEHSYRPPAVPRKSQSQADADQDALAAEMSREFGRPASPPRRPAGW